MLKEVREDNKENDAEHMRPVSRVLRSFILMLIYVVESVIYTRSFVHVLLSFYITHFDALSKSRNSF